VERPVEGVGVERGEREEEVEEAEKVGMKERRLC